MTNMPDKRKKREKREGKKKDAARIPNLPFFVNFSPLLPNIHFQEKTLFGRGPAAVLYLAFVAMAFLSWELLLHCCCERLFCLSVQNAHSRGGL